MPLNKPNPSRKPDKTPKVPNRNMVVWVILGIVVLYLWVATVAIERTSRTIPYNQFFQLVLDNPQTQSIRSVSLDGDRLFGKLDDETQFTVYIPENDRDLIPTLRANVPDFSIKPPWAWANLFYSFAPMLLFIFLFWFLIYRGAQQGGGRILSFGKSHAKQLSQDKIKVTFEDVAGVDEAKEELQEIIGFLKDPKKFQKLGGQIPKGVLLMGPPGTGKTLLAKAVAGEADVPFFSISGSDFVEMFVGVGASRVRDLFEQGKRASKSSGRGCIIFIDEIDAVGRQRFAGIGGGHDEREQTLNALLVEMDGFDTHAGVILLAATNRPDVLDPALVRPGRFDRQVVIDKPDIVGREEILKVHTRNIRLHKDVDLKAVARQTPGFSGADIANLVNEAALLAARRSKEAVEEEEMEASIERVMAGPERKSRVISKQEKEIVAHHEAGHTLVALMVPKADPVMKVSIIPRGTAALGYTLQTPIEDRYLISRTELGDKLTVLLGGRVAEELIFNEITTGAHNDLEVATDMAHRMVCEFGMSKKLGNLTFGRRDKQVFLGRDIMKEKDYSETTAVLIDEEVRRLIDEGYQRAKGILTEHLDQLKTLASNLLEREVLDGDEVRRIVGIGDNGPTHEDNSDGDTPGKRSSKTPKS